MIRHNLDGIALAIIVLILLSVQSVRAMRASYPAQAPMGFHAICNLQRVASHRVVRLPHLHLRLR